MADIRFLMEPFRITNVFSAGLTDTLSGVPISEKGDFHLFVEMDLDMIDSKEIVLLPCTVALQILRAGAMKIKLN